MKYFLGLLGLLLISCAPHYPHDPNSQVAVVVQYENEAPRLVIRDDCPPNPLCKNKVGAECASALYNQALKLIAEGRELEDKKLYLTARVNYLQALGELYQAEIWLKEAKTTNYEDWKVAVLMGLESKIQERIKFCKRKSFLLEWSR